MYICVHNVCIYVYGLNTLISETTGTIFFVLDRPFIKVICYIYYFLLIVYMEPTLPTVIATFQVWKVAMTVGKVGWLGNFVYNL